MIISFTQEEKNWLGERWSIKPGCPDYVRLSLEEKLTLFDLYDSFFEDDNVEELRERIEALKTERKKVMEVKCSFSDVSEHDMDLLFLEEFVCSTDFVRIFTEAAGIGFSRVLSVHSSKKDVALGESDMTVVIKSGDEKIGLLIEDKIDALAMPEQAARYTLRGRKCVEKGEYDRFFVFIIAPEKYLSQNDEAQKYPYKIEYERILEYFEELQEYDRRAVFKIQQIKLAIDKQKKGYQIEEDRAVTDFWIKYSEYQKKNNPGLLFVYNGEIKGSKAKWPQFNTVLDGLYMYHKTEQGAVDLTFDICGDRILEVEQLLSNSVGDYLKNGFTVHRTGKSAAVRLSVPALNLHKPFESQIELIRICFEAIQKMSDTAKLFNFETVYGLLKK